MNFLLYSSLLVGCLLPLIAGNRFVCYYPNWSQYRQGVAKFGIDNIDPSLCTHLMYAFAVMDGSTYRMKVYDSWADIDLKGYSNFIGLKRYNPNLKTMISVGGWTDSTDGTNKYSKLVSNPANIAAFVDSAVKFLQTYGFDGLDLDWEYPSNPSDKAGYVQLIRSLRASFNQYGYLLSAAVAASTEKVDEGYDLVAMSQTMDFINLMAYDMHGTWESGADHLAPLYKRPWETKDNNNIDYVVKYYLRNGFPASKINLGIPMYGQSWELASGDVIPPATTNGRAAAGPVTNQAGILAYSEICNNIRTKGWRTYQDPSYLNGPYAFSPTNPIQWVGYDDVPFVIRKTKYAMSMGLGGVMIWDMSEDDFNNICGGGQNPITTAISQTILNPYNRVMTKPVNWAMPQYIPATTTVAPVPQQGSNGMSGCPQPNGFFPDPSSCTSFYNCNNGQYVKMSCPTGLYFSPSSSNCDWPANVPSCSSRTG